MLSSSVHRERGEFSILVTVTIGTWKGFIVMEDCQSGFVMFFFFCSLGGGVGGIVGVAAVFHSD